ncbi:type I restriction endonuclease subunit R, EcoR124 family [Rhizobium beringeri]
MEHFQEVQRLKTQLDQYTDLTPENAAAIEQVLPRDSLLGFRGAYLETAQRLRAHQGKGADKTEPGCRPGRFRVCPLCLCRHRL